MSQATQSTSSKQRPPVDAFQYEKLALSVFDLCNQKLLQLEKLIAIAAPMCKAPAVTVDERRNQQRLLEVLVETAETYHRGRGMRPRALSGYRARCAWRP